MRVRLRQLLPSILLIVAASAVASYGTVQFLAHPDDVHGSSTTFDLEVDRPHEWGAIMTHPNLAPGDTVQGDALVRQAAGAGGGTASGHAAHLSIAALLEERDADGGVTDLADYLTFQHFTYGDEDVLVRLGDANGNGRVDLGDLLAAEVTGLPPPGGSGTPVRVLIQFHPSAGNDLRGDAVEASFVFTLTSL